MTTWMVLALIFGAAFVIAILTAFFPGPETRTWEREDD